jgi:hypothetical protein
MAGSTDWALHIWVLSIGALQMGEVRRGNYSNCYERRENAITHWQGERRKGATEK